MDGYIERIHAETSIAMPHREFDQVADQDDRGLAGPVRQCQGDVARAISHDLLMHQPPVLAGAKPLVDGPAEKPVLHDPGPGLARVRRRFGAQRFILVLKPGQVSLDHDPFDEPRQRGPDPSWPQGSWRPPAARGNRREHYSPPGDRRRIRR